MADKPWKAFERKIATMFGTTRRLMKGTDEKMDIGHDTFPIMLDCKHRRKEDWSVGGWLNNIEEAATQTGQYPVLVLGEPGKVRSYAVVRRGPLMNFIGERTKKFTNEEFYVWNSKVMPRTPYLRQWDKLMKKFSSDKSKAKVPHTAIPMLFINNKKSGDIVFLKPEDLVRIFKDGGLLKDGEVT